MNDTAAASVASAVCDAASAAKPEGQRVILFPAPAAVWEQCVMLRLFLCCCA